MLEGAQGPSADCPVFLLWNLLCERHRVHAREHVATLPTSATRALQMPAQDVSDSCLDGPLRAAVAAGHVTFVHLAASQTAAAAEAPAASKSAAQQEAEGKAQRQQRQQRQGRQQQQQPEKEETKEESTGGPMEGAAAAPASVVAAAEGAADQGAFGLGSDELELVDDE